MRHAIFITAIGLVLMFIFNESYYDVLGLMKVGVISLIMYCVVYFGGKTKTLSAIEKMSHDESSINDEINVSLMEAKSKKVKLIVEQDGVSKKQNLALDKSKIDDLLS